MVLEIERRGLNAATIGSQGIFTRVRFPSPAPLIIKHLQLSAVKVQLIVSALLNI